MAVTVTVTATRGLGGSRRRKVKRKCEVRRTKHRTVNFQRHKEMLTIGER